MSSLGGNDHEIVEFRILQGGEKSQKTGPQPWSSGERTFHVQVSALKNPMKYSPRDKVVQKNWVI